MDWIKENWRRVIGTMLVIGLVLFVLDAWDKKTKWEHDQTIRDICSFLDKISSDYGRCIDNAREVLQSGRELD